MRKGGLSWSQAVLSIVSLVTSGVQLARADCECGYSVNATSASTHEVFTDLVESNFLTIRDIHADTDWKVQKYFKEPYQGHYGRNCTLDNVVSNPVRDNSSLAGDSQGGGAAGLQLWVRGGTPDDGMVKSGEIRTVRDDMLYGSFRTSARLTPVSGTCSALFTYYNDSQEIDIEMLSRQYANRTLPPDGSGGDPLSPVNLVLHTLKALEAGFQTPNTSTYGRPELLLDLTASFHEYRIDWTPGRASFYLDGFWLWDLVDAAVPVFPSSFLISHWSNGARGWSQGPPAEDAVMTVSYFKAYFNSSDPSRADDYRGRCVEPSAPNAVCAIPDQLGAPTTATSTGSGEGGRDGGLGMNAPSSNPQNASADTYFFSQHANQTNGQIVYGYGSGAGRAAALPLVLSWSWAGVFVLFFLAL